MGRDASEITVSLEQNFLNPPPVPEMPTTARTLPPVRSPNSSATASVIGNTVDEPSIGMSPDRLAYMLGSAALSVWVEPVVPELVALLAAEPVVPVEPPVVEESVDIALEAELAAAPPVFAGVSADGPQAADIMTIAQAAVAASISKRFRVSVLGELINPPRIVGL